MADKFHTITEFRADIYGMIDGVIKTGEPLLLSRRDRIIEVRERVAGKRARKPKRPKKYRDLNKMKAMDIMVEDPDWYISPKLHEWSEEIDPDIH